MRICLLRICVGGGELHDFIKGRRRAGRGWGGDGRGFLEEVKEDIYLKLGHLKIRTNFFCKDRQTDKLTDRQTLWFIGKLHFQKSAEYI